MTQNQHKTAVLVFAYSSKKEAIEKSFIKNEALFSYLNQQTLQTAESSDLATFVFDEKLQKGNSFGERFANAIETIFQKGYEQVITIGNDSPQLKTQQLLDAKKSLTQGKTCLGPSINGGTYLIAIHKKQFHKEQFIALPWQTKYLFQKLNEYLEAQNTKIVLLHKLKDINQLNDIFYFINRTKFFSKKLIKLLAAITNAISLIFSKEILKYLLFFQTVFYNKGSPRLV